MFLICRGYKGKVVGHGYVFCYSVIISTLRVFRCTFKRTPARPRFRLGTPENPIFGKNPLFLIIRFLYLSHEIR